MFPSGINWLTSNISDMSSRQVSIIFLGSNMANCVFPPLASKLFNEIGPTSVFYMTIVALIITLICYSLMVITIRKSNSERQLTQNSPQTSVWISAIIQIHEKMKNIIRKCVLPFNILIFGKIWCTQVVSFRRWLSQPYLTPKLQMLQNPSHMGWNESYLFSRNCET